MAKDSTKHRPTQGKSKDTPREKSRDNSASESPRKKGKTVALPSRYRMAFLGDLDGRSELARHLKGNYTAITDDLGGAVHLSHVQRSLVERFVFIEATLQTWEQMIAQEVEGSADLVGRWISAVNSLQGLGKLLGIKRVAKVVKSARELAGEAQP